MDERKKSEILNKVSAHVHEKEAGCVNPSYAVVSSATAGRRTGSAMSYLDNRTAFARDRDKILYSQAFTKLSGKTQVFLSPRNPLISNRLTHTMMVAQLARSIARAVDANEDLAEAIALGHDLGHPPFGHQGEFVLNRLCDRIGGFHHNMQSLHMVDVVENGGRGMNLTRETREGILRHNGEVPTATVIPSEPFEGELEDMPEEHIRAPPSTLEGCITRICDRIAYVGKDIEDAIEAGIIDRTDIPEHLRRTLGSTNRDVIDTLVKDIIANFISDREDFSRDNGREPGRRDVGLRLSDPISGALNELIGGLDAKGRPFGFNYQRIYLSSRNTRYEKHAENIVRSLFRYFCEELDGSRMGVQRTLESWAEAKGMLKEYDREGGGAGRVAEMVKAGTSLGEIMEFSREYCAGREEGTAPDDWAATWEAACQAGLKIIRDRCKEIPDGVGSSSIFSFLKGMTDEYVLYTLTHEKVRDYITTMTDDGAIIIFKRLFVPQPVV